VLTAASTAPSLNGWVRSLASGPVLEAPAFVADLDDLAVVREPVEQRRRHLRVPEHAWPFAEGEVRRDDDRGSLVEASDEVEQQKAEAV
jgi:hypothetical protein